MRSLSILDDAERWQKRVQEQGIGIGSYCLNFGTHLESIFKCWSFGN